MDITQIILLVLTGIVAGIAAGFFGIGGGVVVIPLLIYVFGMSQHEAQGTSLAFLLAPIGILAFINYYKAGHVNINYAIILAITFIIGAYFGSKWAIKLPTDILKKGFAVLIILMGIKMLLGK
jgi:uncharacterized protein